MYSCPLWSYETISVQIGQDGTYRRPKLKQAILPLQVQSQLGEIVLRRTLRRILLTSTLHVRSRLSTAD